MLRSKEAVILQASNSTGGGTCSLIRGHTFSYVPYMSLPGSTLYQGVIEAAALRISQDIQALTGTTADTEVTFLPCDRAVQRLRHGQAHCLKRRCFCSEPDWGWILPQI